VNSAEVLERLAQPNLQTGDLCSLVISEK